MERLSALPQYQAHSHYLRGAIHLRQGRLIESLNEFSHSADHPELEVETLIMCGQALYQSQRAREAQQFWTKALRRNPSAVSAHRWLGILYYDLGAMDQAIVHLDKTSQLAPEDPRPDRLMGLIYKDYERFADAVPRYRESLRRNANHPDREQILLELAECQIRLSDYAGALESLEQCAPSPARMVLEAECYFARGQADLAQRLTRQALNAAPDDPSTLLLQGRIFLERGDAKAAVETLARAVQLHPMDYALHYNLSQAYNRTGEEENARQAAQRAEQLRTLREEFAALHLQAISAPMNADLRVQLGNLAVKLDRSDLAATWYRAALSLDPSHQEAAKALTAVAGKAGDSISSSLPQATSTLAREID
jgi:tetratricopeptide (TPR) repeat protein